MAEIAVRFSEEVMNEPVGDKEFDEFLQSEEISNGSSSHSETKEVVADTANGTIAVANGANDRIKWKAKRPSKFVLCRTNSDSMVSAPLRALKNSRKSRNGFGRGLPKKGRADVFQKRRLHDQTFT